jgi:16S rRNA (guanine1516-N2)-methyltransferase
MSEKALSDPLLDSSAIGPLRGLANPDALNEESIAHAKRVARQQEQVV